uniref:Tetraspanin 2 n=1 Tax=Nothoprocta perdicaria TaxID=30464 RepID=A0A8C6ZZI6_NOTPE
LVTKTLICITGLFIFQMAGLAVIAFGLWLRFGGVMAEFASDKRSPEYFFMGLYVLVGAGALMTTVGFFGCCGAARESQCLLGAVSKRFQGPHLCWKIMHKPIFCVISGKIFIFGMIFSMVLCCAIRNTRDMI